MRLPALAADGLEAVAGGSHPVVIAGGGPVGMALALGLANHGVRSVILEADDTVCVGSRAACISRRSLEIMARLGVLPAFLAKGLPWTGGRSFYKTEEVFRFEMPHDARQKLPPMINLEQYYAEHYLLEEIERRNAAAPGLIDIRWGTELTGLSQGRRGRAARGTQRAGRVQPARPVARGLRRRPELRAQGAGPGARGHGLRRPLRDHRHRTSRAATRPSAVPGSTRRGTRARPC